MSKLLLDPPEINVWRRRGASASDVEATISAIEWNFDAFRQSVIALVSNLNENMTTGPRIDIDGFLSQLADAQSGLTHELMGLGD